MRRNLIRKWRLAAAAAAVLAVAFTFAACGDDESPNRDAGTLLRDNGERMQSGGQTLMDNGQQMRDSGQPMIDAGPDHPAGHVVTDDGEVAVVFSGVESVRNGA